MSTNILYEDVVIDPRDVKVSDGLVGVQNPLPTDGDSIYAKDIWVENSDSTGWTGDILSPFNDLHTELKYTGTDSPKVLTIHFKRTVYSHAVGFGSTAGGDFHNLRIEYIGSGNVVRYTDDTIYADATPRTSYLAESPPLAYNAIRLTFNTTDDISITNITIRKSITVDAKLSATKPDGTITDIDATAGGNLKVSVEEGDNMAAPVYSYITDNTTGAIARIDDSTLSLQTMDYEHHEIHGGSHYFYHNNVTLANGATQDYLITVPDTAVQTHFTFVVTGELGVTIGLYEGADRTGTTLQTTYNNNRNSVNTAGTIIHLGQSGGTTDGTNIHPNGFGSGTAGGEGGNTERTKEIVLLRNTKYIFRITNRAATNNIVTVGFDWYEHTPLS